jgi:phosphoribosylformylglycinamidine synthase subunit PurL
MKIGIVRYPGSNCDQDALRYFKNSFFIWHQTSELPEIDLLVIPGGFAFGDRVYSTATGSYRIDPGRQALLSPVNKVIEEAHKKGIPILGICNGFQILVKMGLLPGPLDINKDKKFHSYSRKCSFEDGTEFDIPIANKYGFFNYPINEDLVILRYKNDKEKDDGSIAGVRDLKRKVFGIMPHPERLPYNEELKKKLMDTIFPKVDEEVITRIMHSEHVSYKSTKKYLSTLPTEGEHVIQGPGENAGIIDIGDGYALALRIESHNHPIFIDPFQGAATGVGGILRDIFTMGARPIALFDFLRFGTDDRAVEIEKGVIEGISYYGNCIGVPVVGGDYHVDKVYNKNPLINVGCIGILKKENIVYGKAHKKNSFIYYIGARTGKEGLGGADMASKQFSETINSFAKLKSSIQTGDPFLEKLLLEACCELSEAKILEGMQDMGAGGLLCSSLEIILRGRKKTSDNLGCHIFLDKVPTKEYLTPTEILISESQERMLLVCENSSVVEEICKKWDIEYSRIGKVTDDGKYTVFNEGQIVYDKPIEDFVPVEEDWKLNYQDELEKTKIKKDINKWSVYDNTLGGRTIKGPLEFGSYSILDLHEVGKKLYIVWAESCDECVIKIRKLDKDVEKLTVVNCMNFGHPKDCMGNFNNTIEQLTKECQQYNIPVVGGNVSLYNSTDGKSIPPTPIIMMIGLSK